MGMAMGMAVGERDSDFPGGWLLRDTGMAAAATQHLSTSVCGFAHSRPCSHSSPLHQPWVQVRGARSPPAVKLSPRQGQHRGPCEQGPLRQSWMGTDAAVACTANVQGSPGAWEANEHRGLGCSKEAPLPPYPTPQALTACGTGSAGAMLGAAALHTHTRAHTPSLLSTTFVPGSLSCQTSPITKITTIKSNPTSRPTFPSLPVAPLLLPAKNKRPQAGEQAADN